VANAHDKAAANVPLGTLIFRAGLLSEEQLEEALSDAIARGKRLGQILLERGLLAEADLARVLADQRGLPFLSLAGRELDPDAVALLPREAAWLNHAVPIAFEDGNPVVAIDDPSDEVAMRNVRSLMGTEVRFVVATRSEILGVLAPPTEENGSRPSREPANAVAPAPEAPPPAPSGADGPSTCRVVLRLSDGDRVEVGAYASVHRAQDEARSVIRRLAMASASEWPCFEGRFLRPETIVSVDLIDIDAASADKPRT